MARPKKTDEPKKRRGSKPAAEPKPTNGVAKAQQTTIPGTIKKIKALDDAADDYEQKRDARMACTEEAEA